MNIGGFQSCSLSDFPGRVAAMVFLQGCNFRCPYCHNPSLLPSIIPADYLIHPSDIMDKLHHRKDVLNGVVLCGGEPSLQADLPEFIEEIHRMGYDIKLDTNGSRPRMIEKLLAAGLLSYVAMDIKAPWMKYGVLSGVKAEVDDLMASVQLLAESGVAHEFRTTFARSLLNPRDIEGISAMLPSGSFHRIQEEVKTPLIVRPQNSAN
jgi:pyruvate formate lyase activating enzyme